MSDLSIKSVRGFDFGKSKTVCTTERDATNNKDVVKLHKYSIVDGHPNLEPVRTKLIRTYNSSGNNGFIKTIERQKSGNRSNWSCIFIGSPESPVAKVHTLRRDLPEGDTLSLNMSKYRDGDVKTVLCKNSKEGIAYIGDREGTSVKRGIRLLRVDELREIYKELDPLARKWVKEAVNALL